MALAFVDVGVGFADRAAAVVAVGFLRIHGFYITDMMMLIVAFRNFSKGA